MNGAAAAAVSMGLDDAHETRGRFVFGVSFVLGMRRLRLSYLENYWSDALLPLGCYSIQLIVWVG